MSFKAENSMRNLHEVFQKVLSSGFSTKYFQIFGDWKLIVYEKFWLDVLDAFQLRFLYENFNEAVPMSSKLLNWMCWSKIDGGLWYFAEYT